PITDKELNMYSSGRAVHEAVQWLFMSNPGRYEKEKYVEYNDIEGSIDIFDKKRNTPIEFITLRSSNIDKPKSFQEEQLRYYMAMQNSPVGYMMYQCLMHFGSSPWRLMVGLSHLYLKFIVDRISLVIPTVYISSFDCQRTKAASNSRNAILFVNFITDILSVSIMII